MKLIIMVLLYQQKLVSEYVEFNVAFDTQQVISEMIFPANHLAMVLTKQIYTVNHKVIHGLSNRAFYNDLEGPHTQISRSGHSLTLNISKMAANTAIVTMEG